MTLRSKECEQHPGSYQVFLCTSQECKKLLCSECIHQHCKDHKKVNICPDIKSIAILRQDLQQDIQNVLKVLDQELEYRSLKTSELILKDLDHAQDTVVGLVIDFFKQKKEEASKELDSLKESNKVFQEKVIGFERIKGKIDDGNTHAEHLRDFAKRNFNEELEEIIQEGVNDVTSIKLHESPEFTNEFSDLLSKFFFIENFHKEELLEQKNKDISLLEDSKSDTKSNTADLLIQKLAFPPEKRDTDILVWMIGNQISVVKQGETSNTSISLGEIINKGIHRIKVYINELEKNEDSEGGGRVVLGFIKDDGIIELSHTNLGSALWFFKDRMICNLDNILFNCITPGVNYYLEVDFTQGKVTISNACRLIYEGKIDQRAQWSLCFEFDGKQQIFISDHEWEKNKPSEESKSFDERYSLYDDSDDW